MSHLRLVSDNRGVLHPFRMRREREARRVELGIYAIDGGRAPVVVSSRPTAGSYADFAGRAAERRNPTAASEDYVMAPCDVE